MASSTHIQDIARVLERFAPPRLAEDYDNVGLLVGEADRSVSRALIALDVTPFVLEEALDRGCDLVISHHPIWFRPRKHLRGDDFVSRQILFAVRNNLALYACHTNLDNVREGVNRKIAARLGLAEDDLDFLEPKPGAPRPHTSEGEAAHFCEAGSGMIGRLPAPLSQGDFLQLLKERFHSECIRYAPPEEPRSIERVALCGGAGSFLLDAARSQGADAFVTADVTYHKFFDACGELLYCDIGHYESEQFTSEILRDLLAAELPQIDAEITRIGANPVRYFT